jgi:hypothetical protein
LISIHVNSWQKSEKSGNWATPGLFNLRVLLLLLPLLLLLRFRVKLKLGYVRAV